MEFKKLIKSDENDYTTVTYKGYTYDQLSDKAKQKVRYWIADEDNFPGNDYWDEEFSYILTNDYKQYNITMQEIDIEWDNYDRCSVDLKGGHKYWPAFKNIWVSCAKQVLKDLPTFQDKPELLEDWATEAASDQYYDGNGTFETYSGLNDIDGYDGYQLSYKISDLCAESFETEVEPVLKEIANKFEEAVEKYKDYIYSDEYARETCEANEYLFDENGNLI